MTITLLPAVAFTFMLIFARLGTMVMLMPAIGDRSVPVRMRLVLALALTLVLYPFASGLYPALPAATWAIVALFVGEIVVGFVIGLSARLILASLQVAGTTIAFQMGLGFALNFDPTQGSQGALIGTFLSILGLTLILMTDLHHLFLAALGQSYMVFAPGELFSVGDALEAALRILAGSFTVGVQIAAPFLAFGLVFYLGLGVLSRLMPQVQIFFLAMPVNILLGFLLLLALIGALMALFLGNVENAVRPFAGG